MTYDDRVEQFSDMVAALPISLQGDPPSLLLNRLPTVHPLSQTRVVAEKRHQMIADRKLVAETCQCDCGAGTVEVSHSNTFDVVLQKNQLVKNVEMISLRCNSCSAISHPNIRQLLLWPYSHSMLISNEVVVDLLDTILHKGSITAFVNSVNKMMSLFVDTSNIAKIDTHQMSLCLNFAMDHSLEVREAEQGNIHSGLDDGTLVVDVVEVGVSRTVAKNMERLPTSETRPFNKAPATSVYVDRTGKKK